MYLTPSAVKLQNFLLREKRPPPLPPPPRSPPQTPPPPQPPNPQPFPPPLGPSERFLLIAMFESSVSPCCYLRRARWTRFRRCQQGRRHRLPRGCHRVRDAEDDHRRHHHRRGDRGGDHHPLRPRPWPSVRAR